MRANTRGPGCRCGRTMEPCEGDPAFHFCPHCDRKAAPPIIDSPLAPEGIPA